MSNWNAWATFGGMFLVQFKGTLEGKVDLAKRLVR